MASGRWRLGFGAVLTAVVLTVSGCGGSAGRNPTEVAQVGSEQPVPPAEAAKPAADAPPAAEPTETPAGEQTTATPRSAGSKPKKSPTAAPAPRRPKVDRPAPTKKPAAERPPSIPEGGDQPGCAVTFVGKPAPRAKVKAALVAAAKRRYWPGSAPNLTVRLDLVKAVAWQESTWRSNVHACDGGIGLMQIMPDTATFLNGRFEQTYKVNSYTDNATQGANYLAWLTKYFGDLYFNKNYDTNPADCASVTDMCLLNMVISGYNFGAGEVEKAVDSKGPFPNPNYVRNVRGLMTQCPCLKY